MNKKKVGILLAIIGVAAIAGGILWYFFGDDLLGSSSKDKVYVETVKVIMGGDAGVNNRYSGVVESQESWDVNKDDEKTIKELLVAQGDKVKKGDPLFEYDTDELKSQLAQARLDLEGIDNEISGFQNQINELKQERNSVPESEKFQYTTQIQTMENSIKQSEFSKESKNIEIKNFEESIQNAVVVSKISGIIKSISKDGLDPMTGEALPYISVLATGEYQVKGTVNEQNIAQVTEGQPVIIRSRLDEEKTWTGTVTKVDTETQASESANIYAETDVEKATKYPFYVKLDAKKGLILGQHVYVEMDHGQMEKKKGIWLYESYIVKEEKQAYVWVADSKSRLEKRTIELGEYDENLFQYEIKSGLKEKDLITMPMNNLYEGIMAVTNVEEIDYTSPLYQEEGAPAEGDPAEVMPEDGSIEGVPEDGSIEVMPEDGSIEVMPEDGEAELIPEEGVIDESLLRDEVLEDGEAEDIPEEEMLEDTDGAAESSKQLMRNDTGNTIHSMEVRI